VGERSAVPCLENLQGLGQLLVGLRIARGISQRELARRLDIAESQVSRDERNEYHGISVERASRVLQALGARLVSQIVATQSEAS
jgi:transcriptional regulator with XRE-family HTH domain